MTIVQTDDGWVVQAANLQIVAGPFATNGEAWRALDRIDDKHLAMVEANRRIKVAFSE